MWVWVLGVDMNSRARDKARATTFDWDLDSLGIASTTDMDGALPLILPVLSRMARMLAHT